MSETLVRTRPRRHDRDLLARVIPALENLENLRLVHGLTQRDREQPRGVRRPEPPVVGPVAQHRIDSSDLRAGAPTEGARDAPPERGERYGYARHAETTRLEAWHAPDVCHRKWEIATLAITFRCRFRLQNSFQTETERNLDPRNPTFQTDFISKHVSREYPRHMLT